MHKKLLSVGAVVAMAVTGMSAPPLAFADTASTPPSNAGQDSLPVNVTVLLKDQPTKSTVANEQAIKDSQKSLIERLEKRYGLKLRRQFGYFVNGFSATVPTSSIPAIAAEDGVASITKERLYYPTDTYANELTQATKVAKERAEKGEGQVIGIVDTGIDVQHKDMKLDGMNEDGSCGPEALKYVKIKDIQPGFTCKVPGGYNFADSSFNVKDTASAEPHGMHVAGIAAANGGENGAAANTEETGRVTGSAPNAQLLALKVFSNVPEQARGAANDVILAALESAGKLGATVVNLSLGSSNGFSDSRDGIAIAVKKLTDKGVSVLISAGNSGQSTSLDGTTSNDWQMHDNGAVGQPSTSPSALSIASIDNLNSMQTAASTVGLSEEISFPYSHATGKVPSESIAIKDAGLGQPEDFKGDYSGKYALIQRGAISFADKYKNAQAAGAEGVILYNHEAGGEEFVGMAGIDGFTFFSASLRHSDGVKIAEALKNTPDLKVKFSEQLTAVPMDSAKQPSSFTSWGPTSSLDFKPQLGGIGGQVYSTLNDNKYGTMSGTSMASPNVAGLAALINEHYAKRFPDLSPAERLQLSQISFMNTAEVLKHDGIPFSVRQMGAGLAQVDDAMRSDVFATVDGQGAAALREVRGTKTFKVTLTNRGTTDHSFNIPEAKVVTEVLEESKGKATKTVTKFSETDSISASSSQVTVPAGSSADVYVTLKTSGNDHWAHGFVEFTSTDTKSQPTLHMPYLAFAGDWNREPIFQAPGNGPIQELLGTFGEDGEFIPNPTRTSLAVFSQATSDLNKSPSKVWISPNNDGIQDLIVPNLAQNRNIQMVEFNILDQSGKRVQRVGESFNEPRISLDKLRGKEGVDFANLAINGIFNGQVFDPATITNRPIADGHYTYQVLARLSENHEWQKLELPFGVDSTTPQFSLLSKGEVSEDGTGKLMLEASDNLSGLYPIMGSDCKTENYCGLRVVSADGTLLSVSQREDGKFEVPVPGVASVPYVTVAVMDRAGNKVEKVIPIASENAVLVNDFGLINNHILGPNYSQIHGNTMIVSGTVFEAGDERITKVRVNDSSSQEFLVRRDESGKGTWKGFVKGLQVGDNQLKVEGLDASGKVLATTTLHFKFDNVAPQVAITSTVKLAENGRPEVSKKGTVHVTGTYSDNLGGEGVVSAPGAGEVKTKNGQWEIDVPIKPTDTSITVTAKDEAGNTSTATTQETWTAEPQPTNPETPTPSTPKQTQLRFFGPQGRGPLYTIPANSKDLNWEEQTLKLSGIVSPALSRLVITPAAHAEEGQNGEPGQMVVEPSIEAELTLGMIFEATVPLHKSITAYRFEGFNEQGEKVFDAAYRFYADRELPKVHFEQPLLKNQVLYTNQDKLSFTGSISDNGSGYTLQINGNTVRRFSDDQVHGEEVNARAFSWDMDVDSDQTAKIEAADDAGNSWMALVPVVKDTIFPQVNAGGIGEGQILRDPSNFDFNASSDDQHNDTLTLTLDGEEVAKASNNYMVSSLDTMLLTSGRISKLLGSESKIPEDQVANRTVEGATPYNPDAPVDGSEDGTGSTPEFLGGASAPVVKQHLELSHNPKDLGYGTHKYTVTSVDAAGNTVTKDVTFIVDRAPIIDGPETVTLRVAQDQLSDPKALAKMVMDNFNITDDSGTVDSDGSFDGASVTIGDNAFTIVADDHSGDPLTKKVNVKVEVTVTSVVNQNVSYTGSIHSDDKVAVKLTPVDPYITRAEITHSPGKAPVVGKIRVFASEGTKIYQVVGDERQAINVTRDGDALVFEGATGIIFEIVKPGPKVDEPTEPVNPGTPVNPDQPSKPDQPVLQMHLVVPPAPIPADAPFTDVPLNSEFIGEIAWMKDNHLANGWEDGSYRPYDAISREAMAAFLYRLAGSPEVTTAAVFKDVPADAPFAKEITWMKQSGVATGWTDGTFQPKASVSREAMAAFLHRFAKNYPATVSPAIATMQDPKAEGSVFTDVPADHQFAADIVWMKQTLVTSGWSDGTFRPSESTSRNAMAAFIYRLKNTQLVPVIK